jgi:hypothetical protein
MEHRAACACLALLWGCALAVASAAQGKEGECALGGRPSPAAGPRAPASAGARHASGAQLLQTHLVLPGLGALQSGGREGCCPDDPGSPDHRDSGGAGVSAGARGDRRPRRGGRGTGHAVAARERIPALDAGGPSEKGLSGGEGGFPRDPLLSGLNSVNSLASIL